MYVILIGTLLLSSACANDDAQYVNVKSVKGGHRGGGYNYNPGANYPNFGSYGLRQNMTQHGYGAQNVSQHGYGAQNTSRRIDFEVGVCYIEVPTASLVRDPSRIPAGNGSRPDLSRIRSCCQGYIRNIYNFKICDPVCSQECVNGHCSAPETCTCFPDHVKNIAGFCIATCPIGCQNGHCSGGECLCKEGYKLDLESKYCVPACKESCGGIGNCTEPNVCKCKVGYESTPDGNCRPVCDSCINGDCVAPNECRCKQGYTKDQQGKCIPQCSQGCKPDGRCVSPNVCEYPTPVRPSNTPPPFYPTNQQNRPVYPGGELPRGDIGEEGNAGQRYPGKNNTTNGTFSQDVPRNPLYPGNQIYPGNQVHPGHQVTPGTNENPGNQAYAGKPIYPGNQVYPGNNMNPEQQMYPGNQVYPGNNMHPDHQLYPGNQVYPGNQMYPGVQVYPGSQVYGNRGQYDYQSQFDVQSGNHRESETQGQTSYNQFSESQLSDQCSQPCINGVCIGDNICRCNPGYLSDANEPSRCVPNCPGGCPNGVCSAPHFCICNVGYYKDTSVKGRPACVKRIRRSVDNKEPVNVAELLIFDVPDY
ncbi:uncharacterized protein LOC126769128 isoform X2 [Nymphalis io]|uniref:uncharacterized protein LOC126769128 isoform X2 n=1 Tax=Inachis io TaxID=171585 RepID=UPI00216A48B6|nr:uncharacterized protein LOC126769128 isoform X2 [Nymphalis io]